MVDLHCHILPAIDDGAKTLQDSISLLKAESEQGVKAVALTPHFNIEETSIEDFCNSRSKSLKILKSSDEFKSIGIKVKAGAEVYYSPMLYDADLKPLCIEDTDYILIELPVSSRPYELNKVMQSIINRGYIPVLAHVERYQYFTDNPVLLYNLVVDGCLAQINAGAIINSGNLSKIALRYLKWELVQIICTDCHSIEHRPPNIQKAFEKIDKKLGEGYSDWIKKNCNDIFNDRSVDLPVIHKPRKILGFWK